MEEYKLTRLNVDNLTDLKQLYKHVFNKDVSIDFLRTKNSPEGIGPAFIGYIAYDSSNNPAAFYGVFASKMIINGAEVLAAQSGDTMTHPAHQGKGLFVRLAKQTYELAHQLGIQFVFGFPNKNSYPGFVKKLNWIHPEDINMYSIKVPSIPFSKVIKKIGVGKNLYSLWCDIILKKYFSNREFFPGSIAANKQNGLLRDKLFFKYKEYEKKYLIEIDKILIWFKIDAFFWIGDIETCDQKKLDKIIIKLKKIAALCGCTEITVHASQGTILDKYFSSLATLKATSPVGFVSFNNDLELKNLKYTSADFDTF